MNTLTVQEVVANQIRSQQQQASPSNVGAQTVVTVSNLTAVQVQAASQILATAGKAVSATGQLNTITTTAAGAAGMKGAVVTVVQTSGTTVASPATAGTKTLTPTQLQYFKQQALMKQHQQQQRLQEQQLKKLQMATGSTSPQTSGITTAGQKVPMVTAVTTTSAAGLNSFVQIAGI